MFAAAQGSAHLPIREVIQNDRELEPVHLHPNVDEITDPALVRRGHFELAVVQIRRYLQSVAGMSLTAKLTPLLADNACRLHQSVDPLVSDQLPLTFAVLMVNPRAAVICQFF